MPGLSYNTRINPHYCSRMQSELWDTAAIPPGPKVGFNIPHWPTQIKHPHSLQHQRPRNLLLYVYGCCRPAAGLQCEHSWWDLSSCPLPPTSTACASAPCLHAVLPSQAPSTFFDLSLLSFKAQSHTRSFLKFIFTPYLFKEHLCRREKYKSSRTQEQLSFHPLCFIAWCWHGPIQIYFDIQHVILSKAVGLFIYLVRVKDSFPCWLTGDQGFPHAAEPLHFILCWWNCFHPFWSYYTSFLTNIFLFVYKIKMWQHMES